MKLCLVGGVVCGFVCITQAKLQSTAYYLFIHKTVKWLNEIFFCLLQCYLFNSYVTFSKNNPTSRKSFLDFMSDITESMINTSNAVSSPSSSDESQRSSRTPTLNATKRAPKKNYPPGRLDGKIKNHKLVHIPPTKKKNDTTPTRKCRVCVCEKISRKKLGFSVHRVVFLCIQKAATHDITR